MKLDSYQDIIIRLIDENTYMRHELSSDQYFNKNNS